MLENMNIAVVGANGLFRAGVISLLERVTRAVQEAPDIEALCNQTSNNARPDVALVELPSLNGHPAEAIARLRELRPECRIAILSDTLDSTELAACFSGGADGFLLKDISAETLIESLRLLALGEKVFPSSLAALICGNAANDFAPPPADLSQRELDILLCLIDGDSNKRIANRLGITEATVKVHLKSILRKTRAGNRTQAAIWALQRGLRKPRDAEGGSDMEIFESKLPASRF